MTAQVAVTTTIEPSAPACARGRDHQWRSPYSVLGGIESNPGVWGKGGGVIIREVCAHCACYRLTDTWAQDRSTGEQGLTEVAYEDADDDSEQWVAAQRDEAMCEACPYSLDPHDRRGPGSYLVSVEADADDCEACDAILAQVREAIGPGWSVGWAGNGNGNESDLSIEWEGQS